MRDTIVLSHKITGRVRHPGGARWLNFVTLLIFLSLSGALLGGCFGRNAFEVPREQTAREQAQVAELQYTRAMGVIDENVRRQEVNKTIAALEAVVKNFPQDRRYTPASHLVMAELLLDQGQYRRAGREFRSIIELYPEISDVHAGALFGLGEVHYRQDRFREGKEIFRQLMDTYGEATDPYIADRVALAQLKYRQIN